MMTARQQYLIRDANEGDITRLSELITELGYPCTADEVQVRYANISKNSDYRTLVIVDDEFVVGMAGLTHQLWYEKNGTYIRIHCFVISKDHRGLGIGKILIRAIEHWAVETGANAIVLSSGNRDERLIAHQFYQDLGYNLKSSGFIKEL